MDVNSYSELPPFTQKPTVIGWFFFARFPQCWRGSAHLPLDRNHCAGGCPGVFPRWFLSLFSVGLLSGLPSKS